MDIQHISGADSVPGRFSAASETPSGSDRTRNEEYSRQPPPPEENKGNYVDTYG